MDKKKLLQIWTHFLGKFLLSCWRVGYVVVVDFNHRQNAR